MSKKGFRHPEVCPVSPRSYWWVPVPSSQGYWILRKNGDGQPGAGGAATRAGRSGKGPG